MFQRENLENAKLIAQMSQKNGALIQKAGPNFYF